MLDDPKREKFTQEYHATGNASEAFRRANPKAKKWKAQSVHVEASKMLAQPEVSQRLKELQQESADKHSVTIESLTIELEAARAMAMTEKQSSAAVSASMGKAKLHGLVVDKAEHTGKDGAPLVPVLNLGLTRNKS
jgi:phage terminase small subunit